MSAALAMAGVSKRFGATTALDDVDLHVEQGWCTGLLGPNGAGKTTALSIAVGLRPPDTGRIEVCGIDVAREPEAAKAVLGVLPDGLALPPRLTGRELLTYLGLLRGMPAATVEARTADLLAVLGLDDAEGTLIADYSTGMGKKIGLAAALLHNPRLLVLDEPLEAIDPVSAATIRAILSSYVAAGGTVLFSSHMMAVVEELCDHVVVMARGRVVAAGRTGDVRAGGSLQERFAVLVGAPATPGGLPWLGT